MQNNEKTGAVLPRFLVAGAWQHANAVEHDHTDPGNAFAISARIQHLRSGASA